VVDPPTESARTRSTSSDKGIRAVQGEARCLSQPRTLLREEDPGLRCVAGRELTAWGWVRARCWTNRRCLRRRYR